MNSSDYIEKRLEPQLEYFNLKAGYNQRQYMLMRRMMLIASWLTPLAIFLQFMLPKEAQEIWTIVPMILSTVAVGSYQWEEVHNFGSQWSKFRLVAENLKRQQVYFETSTGPFIGLSAEQAERTLVEIVEKIIEGTDINYFTLVVDPHKSPGDTK